MFTFWPLFVSVLFVIDWNYLNIVSHPYSFEMETIQIVEIFEKDQPIKTKKKIFFRRKSLTNSLIYLWTKIIQCIYSCAIMIRMYRTIRWMRKWKFIISKWMKCWKTILFCTETQRTSSNNKINFNKINKWINTLVNLMNYWMYQISPY